MPYQLWPTPDSASIQPIPIPGSTRTTLPGIGRRFGREHGGKTKTPPDSARGWERWYFTYERLDGSRVRVSADRDPHTGEWFNPHLSSEQP